jgi:BRCT domain type II-containing protein
MNKIYRRLLVLFVAFLLVLYIYTPGQDTEAEREPYYGQVKKPVVDVDINWSKAEKLKTPVEPDMSKHIDFAQNKHVDAAKEKGNAQPSAKSQITKTASSASKSTPKPLADNKVSNKTLKPDTSETASWSWSNCTPI